MPPDPNSDPLSLANYAVLSNVEIGIMAELDHRTISFRDLLVLDVGSVIMMTRPVGENIDLYVDRVLLGTGEILVVDENLAVRVADLRDKPSANQVTDALMSGEKAA